jgi:hypothetical protein
MAFRDASFGSESAFVRFLVDVVPIGGAKVEAVEGDSGRMTRNTSMGGKKVIEVVGSRCRALACTIL